MICGQAHTNKTLARLRSHYLLHRCWFDPPFKLILLITADSGSPTSLPYFGAATARGSLGNNSHIDNTPARDELLLCRNHAMFAPSPQQFHYFSVKTMFTSAQGPNNYACAKAKWKYGKFEEEARQGEASKHRGRRTGELGIGGGEGRRAAIME